MKCLGVTLQSNLSFDNHVSEIINSCASNLYAIKLLHSKGLNSKLIKRIFGATVLSKLLYASQFWWGFASATSKERIESFLKKSTKCNFYSNELPFSKLVNDADTKLFADVISNTQHTLYPLLPQSKNTQHDLRPRPHKFCLPPKSPVCLKEILSLECFIKTVTNHKYAIKIFTCFIDYFSELGLTFSLIVVV